MTNDDTPVLEFPCEFPIKVMGHDRPAFHRAARELVEQHTGPLTDDAIRSATSRNGRFVSLTLTIEASSRRQLDAIYRALTEHDEVLVAL